MTNLNFVPHECEKRYINLDPKSPVRYYGIDRNLSDQLSAIAKHRGISAEKLLQLWVEEKLKAEQIYG